MDLPSEDSDMGNSGNEARDEDDHACGFDV